MNEVTGALTPTGSTGCGPWSCLDSDPIDSIYTPEERTSFGVFQLCLVRFLYALSDRCCIHVSGIRRFNRRSCGRLDRARTRTLMYSGCISTYQGLTCEGGSDLLSVQRQAHSPAREPEWVPVTPDCVGLSLYDSTDTSGATRVYRVIGHPGRCGPQLDGRVSQSTFHPHA